MPVTRESENNVPNLRVFGNDSASGGESVALEIGYKLKPDFFDGGVPLREFFSQFDLIARANQWKDSAKAIALASCLRGKARSVLEGFREGENFEFAELKARLELHFGEGHSSQTYYSLFTSRKQKFGEDMATFGSETERLA